MGVEVTVDIPEPHPGQQRVLDRTDRHLILRCGRRYGKSVVGLIETEETGILPNRLIGWFTPEFQYLEPVWSALQRDLAPLIVRCNEAKHIIELRTGTRIDCWCLNNNPNAGRGRDYDLAVVDEAGLIPGLRYWMQSSLEPTLIARRGRILALGTSNSVSPDFDDLYDDASAGHLKDWGAMTATTFDNPTLPADELAKVEANRGEWPDWLWKREYLAIPPDSASGFFSRAIINKHTEAHACDPFRGDLVIDADSDTERAMVIEKRRLDKIRWVDDPRGPLRLWFDPTETGGRPVQSAAWCFGIDIGAGVGAANSVASAGDADTGIKWAEYASPGVTPERFAWTVAAMGLWFGGRTREALVQWEVNGVGEVFGREIQRLRYPRLAIQNRHATDIGQTKVSYGWRSTPQAKETLLSEYRGALARASIINPSKAALAECLTYGYDRGGRLASLGRRDDAMDEEARVPHGDRVIADALLWDAMKVVPLAVAEPLGPTPGGIWERIKKSEKSHGKRQKLVY